MILASSTLVILCLKLKMLKISEKNAQNRSKLLEIARNRSNLASADVTLQLRLGFWPVKSGQCSNVLPIVSVVGPNYQFQLLPTLSSMILPILTRE